MARFPESVPWRFLLVDLVRTPGAVLACLDPIAASRTVALLLNQPFVATCVVPSDDVRVNNPVSDEDDSPILQKNTTALVCLRRDGNGEEGVWWTPRACCPILQLQDAADTDISRTTVNAWGPNRLWDSLPLVVNSDGDRVPQAGYPFPPASDPAAIAAALLADSTAGYLARNPDATPARAACYIDWGEDLGGTSFWGGVIESGLGAVDVNFQLSATLGDGMRQLIATGALDIVITPIWDPVSRPGYLAEGSIVAQAGVNATGAVFAWDVPPNSLTQITRLDDGTPGALVNTVEYGIGVGAANGQKTQADPDSIATFGEMWDLQNVVGQTSDSADAATQAIADLVILLAKQGKTVVTLTPSAERGPVPLSTYDLGDRVRVFTSRRFRQPINGDPVRVNGIPFVIADDDLESVQQILTSADGDFTA